MRFSQGTNYALGADANNNPSSIKGLNGKVYVGTNGSSATGLYTLDFVNDASFRNDSTDYRVSNLELSDRNSAITYNVINTTQKINSNTVNDWYADKNYIGSYNVMPLLGSTTPISDIAVTEGTSTISPGRNTIYISSIAGTTKIQEYWDNAYGEFFSRYEGSVKFYTKDYISEEMTGYVPPSTVVVISPMVQR